MQFDHDVDVPPQRGAGFRLRGQHLLRAGEQRARNRPDVALPRGCRALVATPPRVRYGGPQARLKGQTCNQLFQPLFAQIHIFHRITIGIAACVHSDTVLHRQGNELSTQCLVAVAALLVLSPTFSQALVQRGTQLFHHQLRGFLNCGIGNSGNHALHDGSAYLLEQRRRLGRRLCGGLASSLRPAQCTGLGCILGRNALVGGGRDLVDAHHEQVDGQILSFVFEKRLPRKFFTRQHAPYRERDVRHSIGNERSSHIGCDG
mmetsp:Transcript_25110/g.56473  ORF Transcript_25110/g.56473 Transcript_25110/m.56473 type:complete len:261 (-) Transcript_25110:3177-3959(-)